MVRPPSSCPALGSGLRPARAQALCRASTSLILAKPQDVDGIRTRACPSSASVTAASRVNPTCSDRPGHDRETPRRPCAELLVLLRRRQRRLQRGCTTVHGILRSSPRKRGSTTTLQLTANLRPDGFGAAIQTLARVLDRARAARCRHWSPARDHTCSRTRTAERSEPQSDRSRTACVLHVLASSDHDRLGTGRIARPLSESAAAKPQRLTFRRHLEVAAEGGPRRVAAEGALVVRPPSSWPGSSAGLRRPMQAASLRAGPSTSRDSASSKAGGTDVGLPEFCTVPLQIEKRQTCRGPGRP